MNASAWRVNCTIPSRRDLPGSSSSLKLPRRISVSSTLRKPAPSLRMPWGRRAARSPRHATPLTTCGDPRRMTWTQPCARRSPALQKRPASPAALARIRFPLFQNPIQETLTRCLAEALTNIAKHAHASTAAVNISAKDGRLTVTIKDDGQGFDESTVPVGHYGLLGIRERMRLVDGSLGIQSRADSGTTIILELPL